MVVRSRWFVQSGEVLPLRLARQEPRSPGFTQAGSLGYLAVEFGYNLRCDVEINFDSLASRIRYGFGSNLA